jgi:hypothetical protein
MKMLPIPSRQSCYLGTLINYTVTVSLTVFGPNFRDKYVFGSIPTSTFTRLDKTKDQDQTKDKIKDRIKSS